MARTTSRSKSTSSAPRKSSRSDSGFVAVQKAIQTGDFSPVYYLYGDDDYLKDQAVDALLAAAIDASTRDFNCETRRGGELDAETLGSLLLTPPMFAERRAVVIRDPGAIKKAARKELDSYLNYISKESSSGGSSSADTILLLVSPAGTKVDAVLIDKAESLEFQPLSPDRVRRWIAHHVSTGMGDGISITPGAVKHLQESVGNDLLSLSTELDKCASFALGVLGGGALAASTASDSREMLKGKSHPSEVVIDEDAVAAVVGVRKGETVVDLLDAVAHRDVASALSLIEHVLSQSKVTAVGIVMNLSAQQFALAYGCARRESGVAIRQLPSEYFTFLKEASGAGVLGRPWSEAASAWTKVTDEWTAESCETALELLLEADKALKETSVSNPTQIVTSLVLGICALKAAGKTAR